MKTEILEKFKIKSYKEFDKGGVGFYIKKCKENLKEIKEILGKYGYKIIDSMTVNNKGVAYFQVYSQKRENPLCFYFLLFTIIALLTVLYIIKKTII